jgi:hypothetical protein
VTFARLRLADWVAIVAALALLFAMAADWYSTAAGEEARRVEGLSQPSGAQGGEVAREVQEDARTAAEEAERNAWQADAPIDRVILAVLLAAAGLAVVAGFFRAAGHRFEQPLSPSALAALCAGGGALLVLYRMIEQPGPDLRTTVHVGAPLAVVALGTLALAGAAALRAEGEGREFRELPAEGEPPEGERPPGRQSPAS